MIIVVSIIMAVFVILGILLLLNKFPWLISGYNTMTEDEFEGYDTKAISRFLGIVMFVLAACMVFWLLALIMDKPFLLFIGILAISAVAISTLVFMNTGNRFKKK